MKNLIRRYATVLDQAVSSASNFLLIAFVAQSTSLEVFGKFSLVVILFNFALGAQRAFIGETTLVHYSGKGDLPAGPIAGALTISVSSGIVIGFVIGLCSFLFSGEAQALWLVMAVGALFGSAQDTARYLLIAQQRVYRALLSDLTWLAVAVPIMFVGLRTQSSTVVAVGWIAGACASWIAAVLLLRASRISFQEGRKWILINWRTGGQYFAEFAALSASNSAVWFFLAGPIGAAGIGALRGAQLLYSPLNTALNAIRIAVIPELVTVYGTRKFKRRVIEAALVLVGITVFWGTALLLIPDSVGILVLGDVWNYAKKLLGPFGVQYLAMAPYMALLAYFRVSHRNIDSGIMRSVLSVATLVIPLICAAYFGVSGAAWAFALAMTVTSACGGALLVLNRSRNTEKKQCA